MRVIREFLQKKSVRLLLFVLGFALMLFPIVSQTLYFLASRTTVEQFNQRAKELDRSDVDRRLLLAAAYNDSLSQDSLQDPFTDLQKEGRAEYARMLEVGEQLGHLSIPHVMADIPLYAGTSESILQKGAGHLEGTSLPIGGEGTHAVLTAHRGLPTARLFTDLDKLEMGDTFYVTNIKETLAYEVDQIQVVEPTALETVALVEGEDYVTLLTCTPYMINSHRLLVRGHRVPYQEEKRIKAVAKGHQIAFLTIGGYVLMAIGLCGSGIVLYRWYQKKQRARKRRRRRR